MIRAVLYLRSSKDRSDVSIDAQRRALSEMAQSRGMAVVGEYVDAVESGKDDDRPGFQLLLSDMRDKARGWDHVLVLDTSRVARRRTLAILFEEQECKKHGVRVVYKSLPESDPITEMLLKSILQAMDEWHSLTSKTKGLAGMAENIRQGFRAGGKAPRGYRLQHESTGAVRDGMPVRKSRLVPGDDAMVVRAYLQHRAKGLPRARALELAGAAWAVSTCIEMERNAYTYAGHTVWNRHAERTEDGYAGGEKFRPEKDWVTQRDTHEPLINDAEAAAILEQLEAKKGKRSRDGRRVYTLAGLLVSPDGEQWHGCSGYYRLGKGKRILADSVEQGVLQRILADIEGDGAMHASIAEHYNKLARGEPGSTDNPRELKRRVAELEKKVGRLSELLGETTAPAALLRQIEAAESEREGLLARIEQAESDAAVNHVLKNLTPAAVRWMLRTMAQDLLNANPTTIKDTLPQLVESVVLDPSTMAGEIRYRLAGITGDKVASPRGFEPIPCYTSGINVAHRRRTCNRGGQLKV